MNRRQFLQTTAVAAAFLAMQRRVYAFAQSDALAKFIQPLRGNTVGSLLADIGVAAPDGAPAPVTGATHYTMGIEQFSDQLHPSLGPTKLWGFKPSNYLGGPPPGAKSEQPRLVHSICYPKVALIRNTSTSRSTSGV